MVVTSNGTSAITLIIAIVGLCVAIAGFIWQWMSWKYEGPKVKVTASHGIVTGEPAGKIYLSVTAVNVGRSPVELTGWGVELTSEYTVTSIPALLNSPTLPHTLNGGHQAKFTMDKDDLRQYVFQRGGLPQKVRSFVSTSIDGKIYGKKFVIDVAGK